MRRRTFLVKPLRRGKQAARICWMMSSFMRRRGLSTVMVAVVVSQDEVVEEAEELQKV